MLVDKTKKVTTRRCVNGHSNWFDIGARYCTACGSKIHKVKEDMTVKVCDQCGKEVNVTTLAIFPVLFCPHCGATTSEHLKES